MKPERFSSERSHKRIDPFWVALAVSAAVLFALLGKLYSIERHIRDYENDMRILERIERLDTELDSLVLHTYHYVDFDRYVEKIRAYRDLLKALKSPDFYEHAGDGAAKLVGVLTKRFETKAERIEAFKSLNAAVTNSIYILYDLRREIQHTRSKEKKKIAIVDRVLFMLMESVMGIVHDRSEWHPPLHMLERFSRNDPLLHRFYDHVTFFIVNSEKLRKIVDAFEAIDIPEILHVLTKRLRLHYHRSLQEEKWITIVFFMAALGSLLLITGGYGRIKKDNLKLKAFRSAVENSDNSILITDASRNIEYVNETFEERTGYTLAEVKGKNPNILKSDLVEANVYNEMNETLARGEIWKGELINKTKSGALLYEKLSIIPITIDGKIVQYLAVKLDVTEYRRQQQQLELAATVYRIIDEGIVILDKERKIVDVNPAFETLFGYKKSELIGKSPFVVAPAGEEGSFYRLAWEHAVEKGRWSGKVSVRTKENEIVPVWLSLASIDDEKGERENYTAIYTDLNEMITYQKKAEFLAYHDNLTGLPNRTYFDEVVDEMLKSTERKGERTAVLFIDLDRFKVVNDSLGHHIGDELLCTIAERLKALCRQEDLLVRFGGDEFVFVYPFATKGEVSRFADRLLRTIRESVTVDRYTLTTTASVGVALYPDDASGKEDLIKYADSAMFEAKEEGKNNFKFYNKELSAAMKRRLALEQKLRHAVEKNEFYLCYQPKYDLRSRQTIGAEALLRWRNENLGEVSPNEFIPVAEETGQIVEIGYTVLETVCRFLAECRKKGLDVGPVAVNISTVQFRDKAMFERFRDTMQTYDIAPEKIELEITERFIMEYSRSNIDVLYRLREMGCRIAIDDFGTGYSSLSHMKKLPIDTIKIDKSFIDELPTNDHDVRLTKGIVALSKSLGYKVVAEGIETEAQERFLQEHRCDYGQGYLYAKPMEFDLFLKFFKEHSKI